MENLLSKRHVLVIGGAGYIGSVLIRKLLMLGYRVRVLDSLIYGNGSSVSGLSENESFSFIHGDFGHKPTLNLALAGVTDVILLAALVGDPICKKYPEKAKKTNLEYPKELLSVLAGRGIDRFVFTSTCSNYGLRTDDSLADELSALNPQSLYAETKVEVESYIQGSVGTLDYSPTILRLSTAFGLSERMRFDLTISEFTKDLAIGKELVVYDENTWRPYCNVSDISEAIIKVITAPREMVTGQVFNVGSDANNFTKKMIIDLIQKYVKNTHVEYKKGGFDPRNYRVSFGKIEQQLNFRVKFSAEDSIKNLIGALNNNLFIDIEERRNFYGNYYLNE